MKAPFIIFMMGLLAIASCKKSSINNPVTSTGTTGATGTTGTTGATGTTDPINPGATLGTTGATGLIVYDIGNQAKYDDPDFLLATVWKNFVPVTLKSFGNDQTYATGAQIVGNDVYVSGYYHLPTNECKVCFCACFWKNENEFYRLTYGIETSVKTSGIAVINNVIYVAGSRTDGRLTQAVYWENGVLNFLPDPGAGANVSGLLSKGKDLYIGGNFTSPSTGRTLPCYWKNGTLNVVDDNSASSTCTDIAVADNGDVYLVGYRKASDPFGPNQPVYWKNGVLVELKGTGIIAGTAKGIAVKGNDVYVVGDVSNAAYVITGVYWKNGVIANMADCISSTGITISGDDVYTTGYKQTQLAFSTATQWKNGIVQVTIANRSSFSRVIASQ